MNKKEQEVLEFIENKTYGKINYVYEHEDMPGTYVGVSNGLGYTHEFWVIYNNGEPEIVRSRRV